jgi:hypothetical protein
MNAAIMSLEQHDRGIHVVWEAGRSGRRSRINCHGRVQGAQQHQSFGPAANLSPPENH